MRVYTRVATTGQVRNDKGYDWIPAFAGMTEWNDKCFFISLALFPFIIYHKFVLGVMVDILNNLSPNNYVNKRVLTTDPNSSPIIFSYVP